MTAPTITCTVNVTGHQWNNGFCLFCAEPQPMVALLTDEQRAETKPVGYYCDHSDEPFGARTHHGWEWDEENGGHTFQHSPNTISSHAGPDQAYLKPEDRERRCPRALPVYAVDVPALLASLELERRESAHQRAERIRQAGELALVRAALAEIATVLDSRGDEGAANAGHLGRIAGIVRRVEGTGGGDRG